ncbi:hypothetical protein STRIP9103_07358 [Streptomyces ipomoeae 91-03]|uniref:Uncharacterized protein n=1 Tax=Streptomyces ipomoeae 91-03 TaxID=698759 RepID=L1KQ06_9ACTN|nr:hypothetical protein STRIP9103_07358 [Streptomyces ipomoeae 91-03]
MESTLPFQVISPRVGLGLGLEPGDDARRVPSRCRRRNRS